MYELSSYYMHTVTRKNYPYVVDEITRNKKRDVLILPFSGPYPQDDAPEIK